MLIDFTPQNNNDKNHKLIIGPKSEPIFFVPKRWNEKINTKIIRTNTITSLVFIEGIMSCNPSTAEVTVIAGVIIPSARRVAPPSIAKRATLRLVLFFIKAKRENTPPSPLLSAFSAIITYFVVVCKVITQNIKLTKPRTKFSLIIASVLLTNDFIT